MLIVHVNGNNHFCATSWINKPDWATHVMFISIESRKSSLFCKVDGIIWYADNYKKRSAKIKGKLRVYKEVIKDLDRYNQLLDMWDKANKEELDSILDELDEITESSDWEVIYDSEIFVPKNGSPNIHDPLIQLNTASLFLPESHGCLYLNPITFDLVLTINDISLGVGHVLINPTSIKRLEECFPTII